MNKTNKIQLGFFMFMVFGAICAITPLAIDMYLPSLPALAKDLSADASAVQMTLSVYTAGFAVGQLVHGPLSDSYGRRPIILVGTLLFVFTSVVCAVTDSIEFLILLRIAQGFAGAAAAVVVQALIRDLFDKEDFARTMSFITMVMMVAPMVAPMLGGHLTDWFGWRSVFWFLALFSVIVVFLILWKIPETLSEENRQPLHFATMLRNYAKLFASKEAMGLMMAGGFSFAGMFAFLTAASFVYIDIYGLNAAEFGYMFSLNAFAMFGMTIVNGRLVKRVGSVGMLRFGLMIQLVAGIGLFVFGFTDAGLWGIVPFVALYISAMSTVGSNIMGLLLSGYPSMAGTATALAGTLRFGVGAAVGALVAWLPSHTPWTLISVMASCAVLCSALYWLFGRRV
ncbi:Bcr/CflA family multidrug efflux MFS transporter [Vibrio sp. JC009]|uniref:Bcr/CflA family multidrug efflux MFS transporter n=1 Tax=Vibrio sp. JC009 TaxID=2912314 RepID=UPI0023B1C662|nr:Bcr/CflA family multidrug efflux MFS transporter [Vibrio sp. JC009]WED22967.1 Bcr/CflA family multidrug efflux MFS transporter [Vibrio sp. JC009]